MKKFKFQAKFVLSNIQMRPGIWIDVIVGVSAPAEDASFDHAFGTELREEPDETALRIDYFNVTHICDEQGQSVEPKPGIVWAEAQMLVGLHRPSDIQWERSDVL